MLTDRKLQGLVIQKELNESLLDLVNVVMGFQVLRLLYNLYTVIYSNKTVITFQQCMSVFQYQRSRETNWLNQKEE